VGGGGVVDFGGLVLWGGGRAAGGVVQ